MAQSPLQSDRHTNRPTALQADGKIVAVGSNFNDGFNYDFALARYLGKGIVEVTVDDTATLLDTGRVRVTGSTICTPAGDEYRIFVRVDQSLTGAVSRVSRATGVCSEGPDPWTVTPSKKSGSAAFASGDARVCFQARTFSVPRGPTASVTAPR